MKVALADEFDVENVVQRAPELGCDVLSGVSLGKTRTGRLWTYLPDQRQGRVNGLPPPSAASAPCSTRAHAQQPRAVSDSNWMKVGGRVTAERRKQG